jgi:SAM-dependent methyltransferase
VTEDCRACGARVTVAVDTGAAVGRCAACGSTSFYDDGSHTAWYVALYEGRLGFEQLPAMLGRLRVAALGAVPLEAAPPPRLRTSDHVILAEVLRRTRVGDVVLDWGCGSGRILQHLTAAGRDAVGVDVSPGLIDRLRGAGLAAVVTEGCRVDWHGTAPAVVVMAELLEHLDDAARVLRWLRGRFPAAVVVASVPSPRRWTALTGRYESWDRPPEHLVRFTQDGLVRLFERTGYHARVRMPAATGQDFVPGWYKRLAVLGVAVVRVAERLGWHLDDTPGLALPLLWAHALYVRVGRVLGSASFTRWRAWVAGASAESMVAVAVPDDQRSSSRKR